jgi:hypothetical protein
LDIEALIDGLVRYSHGLIMGEVQMQALGYLLGTPRFGPTPILTAAVTTTDESRGWTRRCLPTWPGDHPGKAFLDIVSKILVGNELGNLGTRLAL